MQAMFSALCHRVWRYCFAATAEQVYLLPDVRVCLPRTLHNPYRRAATTTAFAIAELYFNVYWLFA